MSESEVTPSGAESATGIAAAEDATGIAVTGEFDIEWPEKWKCYNRIQHD